MTVASQFQAQLLGAEGEGFRLAMSSLNAGRIGIAAQSLGIAEAALAEAVTYLKQHPAGLETTIRLGDLAAKLEAAKLLVYQAAYAEANRHVKGSVDGEVICFKNGG